MDQIGLRHPHPFVKTIITALHGQICMKGVVEVVVVGTKTPFLGAIIAQPGKKVYFKE